MIKLKQLLQLVGDNTPQLSESSSHKCACCDSVLEQGGVEFKKLFTTATFNLNHLFKNMRAKHICSHCAVFFKRDYWLDYCKRNKKDGYFPLKKNAPEGKKRAPANWFFFSHYFSKNDHRIVTKRQDWRGYLVNPPKPPFCFIISTICKKHLIFQAEIAHSKDDFPVRFEDRNIRIQKDFKHCLQCFENLYNMGLSKASIRTGKYNLLVGIDINSFTENEDEIRKYRAVKPDYLLICEFVGAKNG